MKSQIVRRAFLFTAFLIFAPPVMAFTWKEWLFRIFGIDQEPYEKLVVVRDERLAAFPTGNCLQRLDFRSNTLTTLWKSDGLLSPLTLKDGRIAILRRSPAGESAATDGIWIIGGSAESPRQVVSAPNLVQILGENSDGLLFIAQQSGEGPDSLTGRFVIQMADLMKGILLDPPESLKREINLDELDSMPHAGRVRNNRLLNPRNAGGLSVAPLRDNPTGEFTPLGPALRIPMIDPVWSDDESAIFVSYTKTDEK